MESKAVVNTSPEVHKLLHPGDVGLEYLSYNLNNCVFNSNKIITLDYMARVGRDFIIIWEAILNSSRNRCVKDVTIHIK